MSFVTPRLSCTRHKVTFRMKAAISRLLNIILWPPYVRARCITLSRVTLCRDLHISSNVASRNIVLLCGATFLHYAHTFIILFFPFCVSICFIISSPHPPYATFSITFLIPCCWGFPRLRCVRPVSVFCLLIDTCFPNVCLDLSSKWLNTPTWKTPQVK